MPRRNRCTSRPTWRRRTTMFITLLSGLLQQRTASICVSGRAFLGVAPRARHVAANVLLSSPSVNVSFHDSPANHHAQIVKQYPKQWAPAKSDRKDDHANDRGRN